MQNDVFISYSSKDTDTANKILAYLESKGLKCWIAHRDISPGANYGEVLMKNITMSKVVVLVLSQHSNNSQQVMREIERAVSKGITIIPFRIEDVKLSDAMEYFISTHQWLDASKQLTDEILDKLSQTIYQVIGTVPPTTSSDMLERSDAKIFAKVLDYKKYLIIFAVLVFVTVSIVIGYKYLSTPIPDNSLAILPFEIINIKTPVQNKMEEELYIRLLKYEDLKIISIDSLTLKPNQQVDIDKTLGSNLVKYVLTGRLRNLGDSQKYTFLLTDLSTSPPKEIWNTSFESGSSLNQNKINVLSKQIYTCIQLESSKWKNRLSESLFKLYKSGQLWLIDDNPRSLQEAEASFRAIIRNDSTVSSAYSALGQTLFYEYQGNGNLNLLDDAKHYCQKSISLDSNDAAAYSVLGMISYYTGDETNGKTFLKHAINLNPNEIPAFSMLGIIYLNNSIGIKESKYYFLRAKQLDPATPINHTNLAAAFYYSRNYNEAYESLNDAMKLDSTNFIAWKCLGSYYERKELFDSALTAFNTALRFEPRDYAAREYLASLQILRGDLKAAKQNLYSGIQADQHIFQLKYLYGVVCKMEGNQAEAKKIWNEGIVSAQQIASSDSSADAFMYLGLFHGRLGDSKTALSYSYQAISRDSSNSDIISGMARLYSILNNKEQMKVWLIRAKKAAVDIDEAYLKTTIDFRDYTEDNEILSIVRK